MDNEEEFYEFLVKNQKLTKLMLEEFKNQIIDDIFIPVPNNLPSECGLSETDQMKIFSMKNLNEKTKKLQKILEISVANFYEGEISFMFDTFKSLRERD